MRMVARYAVVASLAALVIAASPARAGDYLSGFGFGISVPDEYLVLTQDEVQKNADVFLEDDGDDRMREVSSTMRRGVYDRVQAGQLEIFYRTEGGDIAFVDNVNVMMQKAQLPANARQLQEICQILPEEFSRLFGRPIGMENCEMRAIAGRSALYLAFDGALLGTKTLQYQIQRSDGMMLILTATSTENNIPRMLGEFEVMVSSIRVR
ncbi:MAG: hypothetical protein ACKVIW_03345 [bacterium]